MNYSNRVTVGTTWGAGYDAGFVPLKWRVRLTVATDGPIEVSFDGHAGTPTVAGRVGPAIEHLPAPGEIVMSGKSRIWLKSSGGGETVDIEAWD